jgi:hypothetical protein
VAGPTRRRFDTSETMRKMAFAPGFRDYVIGGGEM